jgi:uncharacterized membrane protein YgcG
MARGSETLAGNLKQWLDTSFGVRGARNAASWLVAGGIAYYFIWAPEQRRRAEIEVRLRRAAYTRAVLLWPAHLCTRLQSSLFIWRIVLPIELQNIPSPLTHPLPSITHTHRHQRERLLAKERAIAAGIHAIDRARPIPDPQDRGLIKGTGGGGSGGSSGSSSAGGSGGGGESGSGGGR